MKYSARNQVGIHHCSMIHAFKLFWVHYFDFTGHSTRPEYWKGIIWYSAINLIFYIAIILFDSGTIMSTGNANDLIILGALTICCSIWLVDSLCPWMALVIRRYNDTGLNTKFSISFFIIHNIIILAAIFFKQLLIISIGLSVLSFIILILPSNSIFQKD